MSGKKVATVVVVGDIGRSPRMQYHCCSLLKHGYKVNIVGYVESTPIAEISGNENVHVEGLAPCPSQNYIVKTLWVACTLWWILFRLLILKKSHILLYQNPPAVPGILIAYFLCIFGRCKFIIDWHNYTHSILALNKSGGKIFVDIAKRFETIVGRFGYANLCVTRAMKADLEAKYNVKATVLYDRPPKQFRGVTLQEKHNLIMKLAETYPELKTGVKSTLFTEENEFGIVTHKKRRSAILVSSTSWTPDEDFSILLAALEKYEQKANIFTGYPDLVCIITGKGPMKADYQTIIRNKDFQKVKIIMPWLEIEDYPKILASADLGVCLHYSSSGLDLPMKVVDMFGAGLPVCAIDFFCLSELVEHEKNGFVFKNSDDLAELLFDWFHDFPDYSKSTTKLRSVIETNLKEFQNCRWDQNWDSIMLPIIS